MKLLLCDADAFPQQAACQPLTPPQRDDPPDGDLLVVYAAIHYTQIGGDPVLIGEPSVHGDLVFVVDILVGAFLLHNEDRRAQAQDLIELGERKLVEALHSQSHSSSSIR